MAKWKDRVNLMMAGVQPKAVKRFTKELAATIPMKAPETCSGSVKRPDCRMRYYNTLREMDVRNETIEKLLGSSDEEDKALARLFTTYCVYCIAEHPLIYPYIPKSLKLIIPIARKSLGGAGVSA